MQDETPRPRWFKSSYSTASCTCVEVRFAPDDTVEIRDSKDPRCTLAPGTEPVIRLTLNEWRDFLSALSVTGWAASTPKLLASVEGEDHLRLLCRRSGTVLHFENREWEAFVAGVRDNEFEAGAAVA